MKLIIKFETGGKVRLNGRWWTVHGMGVSGSVFNSTSLNPKLELRAEDNPDERIEIAFPPGQLALVEDSPLSQMAAFLEQWLPDMERLESEAAE